MPSSVGVPVVLQRQVALNSADVFLAFVGGVSVVLQRHVAQISEVLFSRSLVSEVVVSHVAVR